MGRVEQYRAELRRLTEWESFLKKKHVVRVLKILDRITKSLAATSARKSEDFRVLRQTMAYSWSVAAAALPESGRPLMEKWLRSPDKDVAWVMQGNLARARISALGPAWVARWRAKGPKATAEQPAAIIPPASSIKTSPLPKQATPAMEAAAPTRSAVPARARATAKRASKP